MCSSSSPLSVVWHCSYWDGNRTGLLVQRNTCCRLTRVCRLASFSGFRTIPTYCFTIVELHLPVHEWNSHLCKWRGLLCTLCGGGAVTSSPGSPPTSVHWLLTFAPIKDQCGGGLGTRLAELHVYWHSTTSIITMWFTLCLCSHHIRAEFSGWSSFFRKSIPWLLLKCVSWQRYIILTSTNLVESASISWKVSLPWICAVTCTCTEYTSLLGSK